MKNKILIIIVLTIFSCSKNKKIGANEILKIDTSKIAIISCKERFSPFEKCLDTTLTNKDLQKIEEVLEIIIAKQNIVERERFKHFNKTFPKENYKLENFIIKSKNYKCQYVVVKNQKGEKEVWANFFNPNFEPFKLWKTKIYRCYGGGSNFFSFKINFNTNKYYEVWFNAEA